MWYDFFIDKILSVKGEKRWKRLYGKQLRNLIKIWHCECAKYEKRRKISQQKLADLSGVSYGSIKRFETSGQISLLALTKIAMALDMADELRNIFFPGTVQKYSGGNK